VASSVTKTVEGFPILHGSAAASKSMLRETGLLRVWQLASSRDFKC
jgi:hypothetical protein